MRTTWKLGTLLIHNFLPANFKFTQTIQAVTGVFLYGRPMFVYGEFPIIGMFRIDGLPDPGLPDWKASILIAVVDRPLGVGLHELTTGLNFSDGCFTLSNDKTQFNPSLLRAVLKNIDTERYGKRLKNLIDGGMPPSIVNPCPVTLDKNMYSAICPRCGTEWTGKMQNLCTDCGIALFPVESE